MTPLHPHGTGTIDPVSHKLGSISSSIDNIHELLIRHAQSLNAIAAKQDEQTEKIHLVEMRVVFRSIIATIIVNLSVLYGLKYAGVL